MLLSAALVLCPLAVHAAALTTSPGKTSVSVSDSGTLDMAGNIVPLSAQITKGAKKRILQITATLSVTDDAALPAIFVVPTVNTYIVTSTTQFSTTCDPAGGNSCLVTAIFWLDLDAAEAAYPGVFVGQPLNISLAGGNTTFAGGGLGYNAGFNATMVKK
jgi:hypothetical protein